MLASLTAEVHHYPLTTHHAPHTTPHRGKTIKEIERKILNERVKFPTFLTGPTVSMMKGLLNRNVEKRLGATKSTMFEVGGTTALKDHKFFEKIKWTPLLERRITPPLTISIEHEDDISNFDTEFTGMGIPGSLSEPVSGVVGWWAGGVMGNSERIN